MDVFLQQVINGLVMGSMYALVALGYNEKDAAAALKKLREAKIPPQ